MLPSEYKEQQEKAMQDLRDAKPKGWPVIQELLTSLTRKRGMSKTVVTAMVELVYEWTLEEEFLKDKEKAIEILQYLSELTEGKIFVEVIRARVLTRLADYREAEGDINGAKILLQDIQVEAFTTMDTREKTEFIIKQMRLILETKDYVRVLIASRKLSKKTIDLPELEDLKILYYEYLIAYHLHQKNYLEAARCVQEVMGTEAIKKDETRLAECFVYVGLLTILDDKTEDAKEIQSSLISEWDKLEILHSLEECKFVTDLLKSILGRELTVWPPAAACMKSLEDCPLMKDVPHEGGQVRLDLLTRRVLEKNVKIISSCHTRTTFEDITALLGSNEDDIESVIVHLIGEEVITAKIDRSARVVTFGDPATSTPTSALDTAGNSMASALSRINTVVHQIDRERMLLAQRTLQ